MRAVLQRVGRARVVCRTESNSSPGEVTGTIDSGLLVLLGVAPTDTTEQVQWLADKVVGLRIFADEDGKMNRDVRESGNSVLVVSQFTLFGDCKKGRRPSFLGAAAPETAIPLYEAFIDALKAHGVGVETGRFGADMQVELVNDGPVTLILETP